VPKVLTKSVSTTVQIREGETLVIGGLLNNEVTETIKAFPFLGDIPILGSLFRSKQFTSKKTELVVIVTPSLVSSTDSIPAIPNDAIKTPSKSEFFFGGDLTNEFPSTQSPKAEQNQSRE
jgi:pilus assembly protein CpaC